MSNFIYKIYLILAILTCVNCTNNNAKTIPKTNINVKPKQKKVSSDFFDDTSIILNSLLQSKHYYYDTCANNDILKIINNNEVFNATFVDEMFLKFVNNKDSVINSKQIKDWHFLRSDNFNKISDAINTKNTNIIANNWQKIYNKKYIFILQERKKLLPRTQFENYVLGGMFDGGIYFYDLENFTTICYFNFRVNNTSNKIDFYAKYNQNNIYDAMILELIEQLKYRFNASLTAKFGINKNFDLNY